MISSIPKQQEKQQHRKHVAILLKKIISLYSLWIGLFIRLFIAWFLPWLMDQNPTLGVDYTDIDLYVFFFSFCCAFVLEDCLTRSKHY
jgi:sterol desaturase/sphingolipid hydroxylase (fatty acid hydroxylase superfamily)